MTGPRLLALLGAAVLAAPASAMAEGRYVAIGDSIASPADSYVERHAATLGITDIQKVTSGSTSGQVLTGIVPGVVGLIDDRSDTRVVSVAVGGHDYLAGVCPTGWNRPDCGLADNLFAILGRLRAALAADPGDEQLLVLGYYNPASGLGNEQERGMDAGILGRDGRIGIGGTEHGADWGMTDIVRWVSCRSGAILVDAYPAFKAGGRSLMLDDLHPNAAGQAVLADLFADPSRGGPTQPCPATTPFATTSPDAGDGSAHGIVEPRLEAASWWFEYGATSAYGASTAVATLPASAGPRAVQAVLPAGTHHVRLVAENANGRFAGDDQVVAGPRPAALTARLAGRSSVRRALRDGVTVLVSSTGTSVEVRGTLRRPGRDPVVLSTRRHWSPGASATITVHLTPRGVRAVRRTPHPRIDVSVVARGPGGASAPVRLRLG